MALTKKPTTNTSFEQEPTANAGDTAVADRPQEPVKQETVKQEPVKQEPAAAATTAIAKASATSLTTADAAQKAKAFAKELQDMHGASDFSYGNFAVYKGSNGEICESGGDGKTMGRWVKVRLLAWDDHHEVSPGESGASTKDFVAYSKDGVTVDSVIGQELQMWVGRTVADYVEYLRKEEEFSHTKTRRFIDTACAVLEADSAEAPVNTVVQITLSETSIPAFSKYQQDLQNRARCAAMGLAGFSLPDDPFAFVFVREVATKGSNRWTKLRIESEVPTKL
jgi:hypothetical protein